MEFVFGQCVGRTNPSKILVYVIRGFGIICIITPVQFALVEYLHVQGAVSVSSCALSQNLIVLFHKARSKSEQTSIDKVSRTNRKPFSLAFWGFLCLICGDGLICSFLLLFNAVGS